MKTVITKTVQGYPVVTAFGRPAIDPAETRPRVEARVRESDAHKRRVKLQEDMRGANERMRSARGKARQAREMERQDPERRDVYQSQVLQAEAEYQQARTEAAGLQEQARVIAREIKQLEHEAFADLAVYQTPKSGEYIITDTEYSELQTILSSLTETERLAFRRVGESYETERVPDHRGREYYIYSSKTKLWRRWETETLGEAPPKSAVEKSELTVDQWAEITQQRERQRIAEMSAEDREAAKQSEIDAVENQAVTVRNKAEIKGESKPLEKAQKWLADRTAEIEAKYADADEKLVGLL